MTNAFVCFDSIPVCPKQEVFCSPHNQSTIQPNRWVDGEKKHTVLPFPHFVWTVVHKTVQNKTIDTLRHNTTSNNPWDRFFTTYFPWCQRITKCANMSEKSYPSSIKNSRHVGLCIIILYLSTTDYSSDQTLDQIINEILLTCLSQNNKLP